MTDKDDMPSGEEQEAVWVRDSIIKVHGEELKPGDQVVWLADEYDPNAIGGEVVSPGDTGTYITDDGPRKPVEAVVRFPAGTFVCDARNVRKSGN